MKIEKRPSSHIPDQATISLRLLRIAEEFAANILKSENLKSVIVPGSVAKGIADEYSDIEIKFIWSQMPDSEQRHSILNEIHYTPLFSEEFEDGEWVASIVYEGVKVDISHVDMALLDTYFVEVFQNLDTSITKQTMFAAIESSKVLYGEDTHQQLIQTISAYPDELSDACIKVNGSYTSWSMRNALLARNDHVALHHLIDATLLQMLRMLFALNKTYLSSYNFKWIDYHSDALAIKPVNLSSRIGQLVQANPEAAILEVDKLLHEVFDLIRQNRPTLDLTQYEQTVAYVRQPQEIVG